MKLSAPVFRLKRQARLFARETNMPLHAALDHVARDQGFRSWSHLSASAAGGQAAPDLFARLEPGDLVLLAARPGNGKTLLGLELLVEAVKAGRPAFIFTLEDSQATLFDRLRRLGADRSLVEGKLTMDTSDGICADHIIDRIGPRVADAVIVIDYLQLLDQRRSNPDLLAQIQALKAFAKATGAIIVTLAQIDRGFETSGRHFPGLADVRMPNPVDIGLFTKACFMRDGEARLAALAQPSL